MSRQPTHALVQFWRDPDLPQVEVRRSSYGAEAFRKHTHTTYSVALVDGGSTTFSLEGALHRAGAGQLVFIEPGRVHACNPEGHAGFAYRMFYVSAAWLAGMAADVFGLPASCGHVAPRFVAPVAHCPDTWAAWCALFHAVTGRGTPLEKQSLLAQAAETTLLHHAATPVSAPAPALAASPDGDDSHPAHDAQNGHLPAEKTPSRVSPPRHHEGVPDTGHAVEAVRRHLHDHMAAPVRLDELARLAGRSRCHLLRMFQQATGLPPHAYQMQLRIDAARSMLAAGHSISRVAADTGFVDQSHFSRVFREHTGATPRQYQRNIFHAVSENPA